MTVSWTKHRFSGGLLVLDATNTVVLRGDPARSFDRFEDPAEIARFAAAASGFRSAELGGRRLVVPDLRCDRAGRSSRSGKPPIGCSAQAAAAGRSRPRISPNFCAPARPVSTTSAERVGAAGMPFGDPSRPIALRGGACRFGAVAAGGRCLEEAQDLPELQLAVPRQEPQFQPAVVRHVGLRQPPQGEAPLSNAARRPEEVVHA